MKVVLVFIGILRKNLHLQIMFLKKLITITVQFGKMKKHFDGHIEKVRRKFNDIQEADKEKKNFNFEELHKKLDDVQKAVKMTKDFDCHIEKLRKKLDDIHESEKNKKVN